MGEGAARPGGGAARSGAPRLGRQRCGGGVVGFDAANVRCGVVGTAGVAVGRGAVAARWRALSTCRGAGWGTRMLSGVLTAVRSDRDRWVWREGVAVVAGCGGPATGRWGSGRKKGGPANP